MPMLRFRVERSDWSDFPNRHDTPGWNPCNPHALYDGRLKCWTLEPPSLGWLVVQGQRDLCDYTIRANIGEHELPTIVITPWTDLRDVLHLPDTEWRSTPT